MTKVSSIFELTLSLIDSLLLGAQIRRVATLDLIFASKLRATLKLAEKYFQLRTCDDTNFRNRSRPVSRTK